MAVLRIVFIAAPFALAFACAARSRAPQGPAPAASEEPVAPVQLVSTSFVVGDCPDAKTMSTRAAEAAMRKLVSHCGSALGRGFHFKATLRPGGRIELASPGGDAKDGVVPTCVLSHSLTHSVALKEPCVFDVRLEERPIPGPEPASSSSRP
jgi:hypothetical protein